MKKILTFTLVSALFLSYTSCKKTTTTPTGSSSVYTKPIDLTSPAEVKLALGEMPATFTKKAVIEEATAAWCGYCPYGAINMKDAIDSYPDKVYGVAFHDGDVMSDMYDSYTSSSTLDFETRYAISGIPGGLVNRMSTSNNYNSWKSICATELSKPAVSGLGIITQRIDPQTFAIDVHCGFSTSLVSTDQYYMVAYLLEDAVHKGSAYDQHNYADINSSSPDPTSPYYKAGDPMSSAKYIHNHLLRQVLYKKGIWGTLIPTEKITTKGEFNALLNVYINPEFNQNNLTVIAMIVKKGTGATQDYIENVQECKLGSIKKWD